MEHEDSPLQVQVLGPVEVTRDGGAVPLGGPKQRTVFALLVAAVGRRVGIDELILGVYGESAEPGARRTVQTYVSNLRHEFGDAIHGTGDGYILDLPTSQIDVGRFEHALHAAGSELEREPDRAADRLREALALWRGHPYADVQVSEALEAEVARLEQLRLVAVEQRIEAELALGHHRELIGELEALTAEHPFRESFRAQQLVALYRSGRQGDALAVVERTRRLLADELGVDPSPPIQRLEHQILIQDPVLDLEPVSRIERRSILVAELDADTWSASRRATALMHRDELLQQLTSEGATVLGLRGTAVFVAFPDVTSAIDAALGVARLGKEPTFRVGVDHGPVEVGDDVITGPPVQRAARIVALGHPGQVLLSADAHETLSTGDTRGWRVTALGRQTIQGVDEPLAIYQLHGEGLPDTFPPLRPEQPPPAVPSSTTASVPGYELREPLGSNGASGVRRAYQPSLGREVAVRVWSRDLAADPAFIRRFEAEAQRIARLSHPHLVPLLDYWRGPDGAFLVHPLLRGGDLRERMGREAFTRLEVAEVLEPIAAALSHAHQHGVLHGRVHPGNVLFDEEGNLYVADLGLAQMAPGSAPATLHAYTAPEAVGDATTTIAADVYAFGVLAWELLEGRPPPQDRDLPLPSGALGDLLGRATSSEVQERPADVATCLVELRELLTGSEHAGPVRTLARNPYRGLEPFLEADAGDFHGRDALVAELVNTLATHPLVTVVGPSGVGKSSVVRAGLIPALRQDAIDGSSRWLITDLVPGAHPFEELAAALRRVAVDASIDVAHELRADDQGLLRCTQLLLPPDGHLLVLIDQFEELFTQTRDATTCHRFLDLLVAAADDPQARIQVVATLRADLLDRPLHVPAFAEAMRRATVMVRAPDREELARIVREPAVGVGVEVEERLVERIVADAGRESGALPLVQRVLYDLFTDRETDRLTLAAYEEHGGLQGAIGRKAEQLYLGLPAPQRDLAREVFLRLVTVDDGGVDSRRRVRTGELAQLDADEQDIDRVLEVFGHHRLMTFDRDPATRGPTVEVAHEALLREWDRLRGWIEAVREDLRTRQRISAAAQEWEDSDRDASVLLRGARLELAEQWTRRGGLALTGSEGEFLTQSRLADDAETDRANRRRRRVLTGMSAALVAMIALTSFALVQRGMADEQTQLTRARELAGDAKLAIAADPERAILLAMEALDTFRDSDGRPVPEATSALHAALQASRVELHLDHGYLGVAFSPDGRLLVTDVRDGTDARILDAASGELIVELEGSGDIGGIDFAPDGESLAVSYRDTAGAPAVEFFEVDTWRSLGSFDGPADDYISARFTDDGRHVIAFGWNGQLAAWDVTTSEMMFELPEVMGLDTVAGTPTIAVTEGSEEVRLIDVRDGTTRETLATPGITGDQVAVDGDRIALTSFSARTVQVWDRRTGERLDSYANSSPQHVAWAPDGRLVQTDNDGGIRLVHVGSDQDELLLQGHTDGVLQVAFTPDGTTLASVGWADEARVWDITPEGPGDLGNIAVPDAAVWETVPGPDGTRLLMSVTGTDSQRRIDLVDPTSGERQTLVGGLSGHAHHGPVIASDLTAAAVLDADVRGHIIDLPSGETRLALPPCTSPRAISPDGSRVVVDGRMACTSVPGTPRLADPPDDAMLHGAVLDARSGDLIRHLGDQPINWATFGPAGTPAADLVAVSVNWDIVELHDLEADERIGTMHIEPDFTTSMWFSDDGQQLAFGTQSSRVTVIDVTAVLDGVPLEEALEWRFTEPASGVVSHTRIADGWLATGSMAGHVRIYDLEQRRLISDIEVQPIGPVTLAFTHDATALLYEDGRTVRRFDFDEERLRALATSRLTRGLTARECTQYRIEGAACPA